ENPAELGASGPPFLASPARPLAWALRRLRFSRSAAPSRSARGLLGTDFGGFCPVIGGLWGFARTRTRRVLPSSLALPRYSVATERSAARGGHETWRDRKGNCRRHDRQCAGMVRLRSLRLFRHPNRTAILPQLRALNRRSHLRNSARTRVISIGSVAAVTIPRVSGNVLIAQSTSHAMRAVLPTPWPLATAI